MGWEACEQEFVLTIIGDLFYPHSTGKHFCKRSSRLQHFPSPFGQYRGDLDVWHHGAVICHLQSDMYHPAARCDGEPLRSPRLSREPSHSRCGCAHADGK
jgi:hypothetical protein